MALHIRDNKIMTEKEAFDDSIAKVFAYIVTAGLALVFIIWLLIRVVLFTSLFVFSPGVLVMSLITNFVDLSTGQLWLFSIIISSIICLSFYLLRKIDGLKAYLGLVILSSIILFVSYRHSSSDSPNFAKRTVTTMVWNVLDSDDSEEESSVTEGESSSAEEE